jgi:hypothetical protein
LEGKSGGLLSHSLVPDRVGPATLLVERPLLWWVGAGDTTWIGGGYGLGAHADPERSGPGAIPGAPV